VQTLADLEGLAGRVPLSVLVKAHLIWRDTALELAGDDADAVADAADAALVRLAERFDRVERPAGQAERPALHDSLTGLPNEALLMERMRHALRSSTRYGDSAAVVLLDLDGFASINESFGHDAGDHLLIAVADRLRRFGRASDTIARLEGDKFVIFCERLQSEFEAVAVAERALVSVQQPWGIGDQDVPVSTSAGIAVASPGDDAETLLAHAAEAVRQAKQQGPGRYELWRSGLWVVREELPR
jgi:diguanylate cyclase (GGDEF)-like protein